MFQERSDQGHSLFQQVLEVVKHEEGRSDSEECKYLVKGRGIGIGRKAERVANGFRQAAGVGKAGERDEIDGVMPGRGEAACDLDGEAGLSGAPGASEGHEATSLRAEHPAESPHLGASAEEAGDGSRKGEGGQSVQSGRDTLGSGSGAGTARRGGRRLRDGASPDSGEEFSGPVARSIGKFVAQQPFELAVLRERGLGIAR
jgi:hypothetical protein